MDNNKSDNQQPVSDDQELAKVLNGGGKKPNMKNLDDLQFEESPLPTPTILPAASNKQTPPPSAATSTVSSNSSSPSTSATSTTAISGLDAIKKDALEQLRPLASKLNLPAEEKFDTLLLIIRSTDDQSLLGAAHEAAKSIEDESRRAQALLDVIKEIDYFSSQK